jgi:hypothetical protein
MTNRRKDSMRLHSLGAPVAAAIMAVAFSVGAPGQEQKPLDAGDVADGMRLYQQKGNCQSCHGWAGDGRKTDSQMPDGPNLRDLKLNRAALIMIIKCGILNSQMPAFDKFAYSDRRCYGKTQADLKSYPNRVPDPPATLQQPPSRSAAAGAAEEHLRQQVSSMKRETAGATDSDAPPSPL